MKRLSLLIGLFTTLLACNIASADKSVSGSISLGGALSGAPTQHTDNHPTSAIAAVDLRLTPPEMRGASLDLNIRHAFNDDIWGFWKSKCRFVADLNVPVQKGTSLFVNYERDYAGRTNDFVWGGIRCNF